MFRVMTGKFHPAAHLSRRKDYDWDVNVRDFNHVSKISLLHFAGLQDAFLNRQIMF